MKSVWEKLVRWLRALFQKQGAQQTLCSLDADEIRRERIRIEQTELRLTREIEGYEKQKEELFRKGVEGGSDRQRLHVARKIREIDGLIQARSRQLSLISRNLRVLNGVAQLKEHERLLKDLGMEGLVGKMDLTELQAWIEQSTIEGQFQMERFTKILGAIDEADGTYESAPEDEDTLAILDAMQQAAQIGTTEAISEGVQQIATRQREREAVIE